MKILLLGLCAIQSLGIERISQQQDVAWDFLGLRRHPGRVRERHDSLSNSTWLALKPHHAGKHQPLTLGIFVQKHKMDGDQDCECSRGTSTFTCPCDCDSESDFCSEQHFLQESVDSKPLSETDYCKQGSQIRTMPCECYSPEERPCAPPSQPPPVVVPPPEPADYHPVYEALRIIWHSGLLFLLLPCCLCCLLLPVLFYLCWKGQEEDYKDPPQEEYTPPPIVYTNPVVPMRPPPTVLHVSHYGHPVYAPASLPMPQVSSPPMSQRLVSSPPMSPRVSTQTIVTTPIQHAPQPVTTMRLEPLVMEHVATNAMPPVAMAAMSIPGGSGSFPVVPVRPPTAAMPPDRTMTASQWWNQKY